MQPRLPALKDHHIAAIVLAAGLGTRMRQAPKMLLPLNDGKTLLRHSVENVLALQPSQTIVVVRADLPELESSLTGLPVRCVPNPRYMEGMGISLAAGVLALDPDIEAVLVVLGDEPHVTGRIFERLVEAFLRERMPVTIPRYGEQFGPPTIFSREIFPLLAELEGDTGGRQIVARQPELACVVPFAAEERPADVDTPEDYRALL
ncbi:MAG TPA: nucleotidyltransferase family protein [Chloroflexia bacterium]